MIALDTNILVYAHRRDARQHAEARLILEYLENGAEEWSIPSLCFREFFAVVTNRKTHPNPTSPRAARQQIAYWQMLENLVVLSEYGDYWACLDDMIRSAKITRRHVHDAHIAAICITHGARELWTADRASGVFLG
jgi:uncharacterized protein